LNEIPHRKLDTKRRV